MIDLAIGQKANPIPMEHAVAAHPEVRDALMMPTGKHVRDHYTLSVGLLVEMKSIESISDEKCEELIKSDMGASRESKSELSC
jgi:hypothetical protein